MILGMIKRLACKHEWEFVRNIYGDEINLYGGRRSVWRCGRCGKAKLSKSLYTGAGEGPVSDKPSNGMTLEELRDEFDWMYEFQSRMAERIRDDADVHSLAGYVGKLESENAKLRELCADMFKLAGEGYVPFEDADDWMARDGDIERRMRELGIEVRE